MNARWSCRTGTLRASVTRPSHAARFLSSERSEVLCIVLSASSSSLSRTSVSKSTWSYTPRCSSPSSRCTYSSWLFGSLATRSRTRYRANQAKRCGATSSRAVASLLSTLAIVRLFTRNRIWSDACSSGSRCAPASGALGAMAVKPAASSALRAFACSPSTSACCTMAPSSGCACCRCGRESSAWHSCGHSASRFWKRSRACTPKWNMLDSGGLRSASSTYRIAMPSGIESTSWCWISAPNTTAVMSSSRGG